MLVDIFHFNPTFNEACCKQAVETQIRRRVLRRLIWFCTICLCPTKWTIGLYKLNMHTQQSSGAKSLCRKIYLILNLGCMLSKRKLPKSCLFLLLYVPCQQLWSLRDGHTFSWAGLSKRLTSNLCTYFRL